MRTRRNVKEKIVFVAGLFISLAWLVVLCWLLCWLVRLAAGWL